MINHYSLFRNYLIRFFSPRSLEKTFGLMTVTDNN